MLIMESPRWPFTVVQQPNGGEVSRDVQGSPSCDHPGWLLIVSACGWLLMLVGILKAA
jgi:hypothetical protein